MGLFFRLIHFSALLVFLAGFSSSHAAVPDWARSLALTIPEPGQHICIPNPTPTKMGANTRAVHGICRYRVKEVSAGGLEAFKTFVARVRKHYIRSYIPTENKSNWVEPEGDSNSFIVSWWVENDDGLEDKVANEWIAERLKEEDRLQPVRSPTYLKVEVTLYSVEESKLRDFGLTLGSFYGKRDSSSEKVYFEGSSAPNGVNGLLNLGNPFSSIFKLGFNAAKSSLLAEEVRKYVFICAIGEYCNPSDKRIHHLTALSGSEHSEIGLSMSGLPTWDKQNPDRITLQGASLLYSTPTQIATTPQEAMPAAFWAPLDGSFPLALQPNTVSLIASKKFDSDVRTGALLSSGKSGSHQLAFILLSTTLLGDRPEWVKTKPQLDMPTEASHFTDNEVEALNLLPTPTFKEILESMELVCFDELVDLGSTEKICGFRFSKMNLAYENTLIRWELKKTGSKMKDKDWLHDPSKRIERGKRLRLYFGNAKVRKGFYMIPRLKRSDVQDFELTAEIDPLSQASAGVRARESVRRATIRFTYTPGQAEPVHYDGVVATASE